MKKRAYDREDWRHWRAAKLTWQGRAQEDLPGGVWRRIWTRQQNQRWKLIAFVVTMGLSCFLFEIWPLDRQQTDRRRINVFKHHISMALRTNVSKHHISMAIKAGNRNSQVLQEGLGAHINFHNVCVVYTLWATRRNCPLFSCATLLQTIGPSQLKISSIISTVNSE